MVRLHSGDPALWGAMQEQVERCQALGLAVEVVPGVSAYAAVAAAVRPGADRPRGGPVGDPDPAGGRQDADARRARAIAGFAAHGTTMAVFLSAARARQLAAELLAGGYHAGHAGAWSATG